MVRGVKATNPPPLCQYDYSDARARVPDLANYIVWSPTLPILSYPDKARELARRMNSKYKLPNSHWDANFHYDGKDIVLPPWRSDFGINPMFLRKIIELLQEQKRQEGPSVVAFSTEILPGMNEKFPYIGSIGDSGHSKDEMFYRVPLGSRQHPESPAKGLSVWHFLHLGEADPTRCYFMCRLGKQSRNAAESPNEEQGGQQLEAERKMVEAQRMRLQFAPVAWNHPQTQSRHLPCLPGAPARALLDLPCSPPSEPRHHSTPPDPAVDPAVPPSGVELPDRPWDPLSDPLRTPAPLAAEGAGEKEGLLDISLEGHLLELSPFDQCGQVGGVDSVEAEDLFQECEKGDSLDYTTPPPQTSPSWDSSDEIQCEEWAFRDEWEEQLCPASDPLFSG